MVKSKKMLVILLMVVFIASNLYSENVFAVDPVAFNFAVTANVDFNGTHSNTLATNNSVTLEPTIYDHTTPVAVVSSAYDTSGNGGRKIVRLSNGYLISATKEDADTVKIYRSTDNGATWSTFFTYDNSGVTVTGFTLASYENTVHFFIAYTYSGAGYVYGYTYNGVTGSSVYSGHVELTSPYQTTVGTVSAITDSSGNVHVAWASKNSTYLNCFNIRYSKSTDGGSSWATPTQISTINIDGYNQQRPCIVINGQDNPVIIWDQVYNGENKICNNYFDGNTWVTVNYGRGGIYEEEGTYQQSNVSAAVDSNGVIHVVWYGTDAINTNQNIKYSKSTDQGATWASVTNLTTGSDYVRMNPSITVDNSNNIYVFFQSNDANSGGYHNIHKIIYSSGSWGAVTKLTNNTTAHAYNPSVCRNYNNFIEPLTIWQDNQVGAVKFYGKWASTSGYQSSGTYTHGEIDISSGVVASSNTITYNKTTPANTSLSMEARVYNGTTWSEWTAKNSGDTIIPNGTNLTGYKVQWRANFSTSDTAVTPNLDDVTISNTAIANPITFNNIATLTADFNGTHSNTQVSGNAVILNEGTFDSYTKLMLHMNGTDGSTTFTDSSSSPRIVTANGDAQIDTAQYKFGAASGLFDGTGDYLEIADSEDWAFGTNNFTVDAWIYLLSIPSSGSFNIISQNVSDGNNKQRFFIYNSSGTYTLNYLVTSGGVDIIQVIGTVSLSTENWHHVALTREGNAFTLFLNGESVGTLNNSSAVPDFSNTFVISGINFNGYIDELRVSKGITRWTGNFTPPTNEYNGGYVASGTYTHSEIDISSGVIANDTKITYNKTTPANTSLSVEARVYNGTTWSDWAAKNSGDTLVANGTNLTGYKVQWRANLSTSDTAVTPSLDDVTVSNSNNIAVTGVSLNKASTIIVVGSTETLIATVAPENASNKSVTWSSSNETVATVSSEGVVSAVSPGTAVIIVTTVDGSFTATCDVTAENRAVTGISLKTSTTIGVGQTETLVPTFAPEDATNKSVTWSSNNTAIATVDANGTVTGLNQGTAIITVTSVDGGYTATCSVCVKVLSTYTIQYEYDENGNLISMTISET